MMVDDTELAELVREAGDAIDVPTDGAERILARRDELSTAPSSGTDEEGRRGVIARRLLAVAALIVVFGGVGVLLTRHGSTHTFAGVAGSLDDNNSSASRAAATATPFSAAGAAGTATSGGTSTGSAAGTGGAAGGSSGAGTGTVATPGTGATTPAPPALPTRVIKTGTVSLVVPKGRLSPTVDQLTNLSAGLGGYVSDAKTTEGGDVPTGDLTIRVPVGQFETLLGRVRSIGKPTSITTSGQDVTAQYVDLDARITALQDTRNQLLQILARATQIGDILNVEQQLSGLQTQIEQLQGQQRVLDDQTTFGTVAVHLSEVGAPVDPVQVGPLKGPSGWAKAWQHARHSFAHGIQSVIAASGGVGIFLLSVALLALLARFAWTVIRRRLV